MTIQLSDVAKVESGAGFPIEFQGSHGERFPFLKVSDMNLEGNERRIHSWNHSVSEPIRTQLRAKAFPVGALIFPKIGAAIATNKKRQLTRPSCVDNNVMAIVPDTSKLNPDYLYFAFLAKNISDFASASNPPSIRKPDVENWKLPVPSIAEQIRVVEILTCAESIVRLRRDAHQKAADLVPAIFHQMFGDPACNSKNWPVQTLGELLISGPTNGLYKHKSAYGNGVPILRIDAFYDGVVRDIRSLKRVMVDESELRRFGLAKNDIIINRVNSPEYLGKSAIVPPLIEPTVFESNMMRLTVNPVHLCPGYVIALLQTKFAREHFLANAKHAINQSSINQQDVKALQIMLPPLIEQERFQSQVAAAKSIQSQQSSATVKARAAFDALLAQVFS